MRELNEFDRQVRDKLEGYEYDLPEGMMDRIYERRNGSHRLINYFRLRWRRSFYLLLLLFMSSTAVVCFAYFYHISKENKNDDRLAVADFSTINHAEEENIIQPIPSVIEDAPETESGSDSSGQEVAPGISTPSARLHIRRDRTHEVKSNRGGKGKKNKIQKQPTTNQEQEDKSLTNSMEQAPEFMQSRKLSQITYTVTDTLPAQHHMDYADEPLIKKSAPDRWRIDVYAGPAFGGKTISTGSKEMDAYKKARQDAESFSVSFTTGMNLNYSFNEHWSVKGGISYTDLKEKIRLVTQKDVTTMTIHVDSIPVQNPGQEDPTYIYKYDTLFTHSVDSKYQTANNHYRMIEIPISLSYQVNKGRWSYAVGGGVVWNLSFNAKGSRIDDNDSLQVISYTKNDNPYKPSLALGATGNIEVRYYLSEKWSIYAEPVYRYYFMPATKQSTPAKERFSMLQMNTGVSYRF